MRSLFDNTGMKHLEVIGALLVTTCGPSPTERALTDHLSAGDHARLGTVRTAPRLLV
jgi:hypothetical protein